MVLTLNIKKSYCDQNPPMNYIKIGLNTYKSQKIQNWVRHIMSLSLRLSLSHHTHTSPGDKIPLLLLQSFQRFDGWQNISRQGAAPPCGGAIIRVHKIQIYKRGFSSTISTIIVFFCLENQDSIILHILNF